jgi:hypothetical protein
LLPLFVFVTGFFAASRLCKQEQHKCLANTCKKINKSWDDNRIFCCMI